MDTDDAIRQTVIALEDAPDKRTLTVPREVLEAFVHANWQPDDTIAISRTHGPTLWFMGSNGCAYNIDRGGSELPDESREAALCRALLRHTMGEIDDVILDPTQ